MSLLGNGVIAIWNDVRWAAREKFYLWHDGEHIPERVNIPGFLRGRRYVRLDAEVEWFTLYETVSMNVLKGKDYLERLNHPTPLTVETVKDFYNVTRGLTALDYSRSTGEGGNLMVAGFQVESVGQNIIQLKEFLQEIDLQNHMVCGVHLCIANLEASNLETAERQARTNMNEVPDLVVIIESGWSHRLSRISEELVEAVGQIDDLKVLRPPGTYRLEYELRKQAV
jgi:hypothetical protein